MRNKAQCPVPSGRTLYQKCLVATEIRKALVARIVGLYRSNGATQIVSVETLSGALEKNDWNCSPQLIQLFEHKKPVYGESNCLGEVQLSLWKRKGREEKSDGGEDEERPRPQFRR